MNIEEQLPSQNQELRDKTYDEIELWLAKGWDISDPYKMVRLNTSILEHVDEYVQSLLDQQRQEMVEIIKSYKGEACFAVDDIIKKLEEK